MEEKHYGVESGQISPKIWQEEIAQARGSAVAKAKPFRVGTGVLVEAGSVSRAEWVPPPALAARYAEVKAAERAAAQKAAERAANGGESLAEMAAAVGMVVTDSEGEGDEDEEGDEEGEGDEDEEVDIDLDSSEEEEDEDYVE